MAKRRMFSREIISSDAFMTMGLGSQCLYFHLGMNADDDGVVNNYRMIQRMIGANDDDLRVLIAKKFIIPIEDSGIIVIKHWRINNYIQKDRYTQSKYLDDLKMLGLDENGAYTEKEMSLFDLSNSKECIQNREKMYTQISIGKVSKDKVSKEKYKKESDVDVSNDKNSSETDDELESLMNEFKE